MESRRRVISLHWDRGRPARFLHLALAALFVFQSAALGQDPLQGRVEESGVQPVPSSGAVNKVIEPLPAPVIPAKPKKLHGQSARTDGAGLHGNVEDAGGRLSGRAEMEGRDLLPGSATVDERGFLKGSAAKDGLHGLQSMDPDAEDQELMVEWDRWRNRLLTAIQSGMQETMNDPDNMDLRWDGQRRMMVPRFPLGTISWFYCQVTPDRRIVNAKITQPSGFPNYDRALLEAIHNLQGSSILRYPRGSRRTIVDQEAGIKTAEQSEYRYFNFGDVERQRIPGR